MNFKRSWVLMWVFNLHTIGLVQRRLNPWGWWQIAVQQYCEFVKILNHVYFSSALLCWTPLHESAAINLLRPISYDSALWVIYVNFFVFQLCTISIRLAYCLLSCAYSQLVVSFYDKFCRYEYLEIGIKKNKRSYTMILCFRKQQVTWVPDV